jgi:hypothetical protein
MNGVLSTYYDKFSLTKEIEKSSYHCDIDHNAKLEAGVDFGHKLDGTIRENTHIALKSSTH